MPPDMDKSHGSPNASPGYETRDANTGGVLNFLVILAVILVLPPWFPWGMFRYFVGARSGRGRCFSLRRYPAAAAGAAVQVTPREDWLKYREAQQRQSGNLFLGEPRKGHRQRSHRPGHGYSCQERFARPGPDRAPESPSRLMRPSPPSPPRMGAKNNARENDEREMEDRENHRGLLPCGHRAGRGAFARADEFGAPPILREVSISQNLNAQIPADLAFPR